MSVIIGSTAICKHFSDFKRLPKDLDIAIEGKSRSENLHGQRVEYLQNPIIAKRFAHEEYLNPDALYTLKISHTIGWPIFWEKNFYDVIFLQQKGCKFDRELFDELYAYWNIVHEINNRSDLQMSAEEFFDNAVDTDFDHDFCHEILIKHPFFEGQLEPTYKKILADNEEVMVSEEKFNLLSEKEKRNLVIEEVVNMAFERKPKEKFWNSYSWMLRKFLMNHAPIFEAIWMIFNWKDIVKPPFDFNTFLKKELNESRIIADY